VVGIAWAGTDAEMQGFVDKHHLTFPSANDDPGEIYRRFQIPQQPAWVFFDASGKMELHLGAMEPDELDAKFDELTRSA